MTPDPQQERLRAMAEGLKVIAKDLDQEARIAADGSPHNISRKLHAHALLINAAADVLLGKSGRDEE